MNCKKKILISTIILFFLLPITAVIAKHDEYVFEDKLNDGGSMFFLVDLSLNETIELTLTPDNDGEFYLFLFDKRPEKANINNDNTLNKDIYDNAVDYDSGDQPHIEYTAEKELVYYIEVILLKNGPDYFTLESSKELSRYYLPAVPGYSLDVLIISLIFSVGVIFLLIKKRML